MIAEQIQPQNTGYAVSSKYYQFSAILEHVIDCLHTIVTDETNPYHPPLAWLTRKQPKAPDVELFIDLHDECLKQGYSLSSRCDNVQLSSSVRARLEKCPQQQRQEIVSRTRDGCAPLFIACKNGLTRVVKYLLDVCGADIEQIGRFETLEDHHVHSVAPIWVAAVSGHLETVRLLIERGANINSISDTGSTPLRSVCFLCKDDDGVEGYNNFQDNEYDFGELLDKEDKSDNYMTIVCLLVENGADIKRPNFNGGTCLINSLHNYHLTRYLIGRGVAINDCDNQSKTALHYAIQQNRIHVVKLLLDNGADPFLKTKNCDDALRLSCIGGHEEIFEHLLSNYNYDAQTVSYAYKLLGSSILEIHCDLARVRRYWTKSLEIIGQIQSSSGNAVSSYQDEVKRSKTFDIRRSKAFRGMIEFSSLSSIQQMAVDDIRVQSLIISEKILGSDHHETIQRLLYRGTFYINSLRPDRCLDLWIYALKLRLDTESIFHFESIFAAQAITKLFLDLLGQRQQQHYVRFSDVYDVLLLLVGRLEECKRHLSWRPRSCSHEDIYNLLLNMIVKLILILRSIRRDREEYLLADGLISDLVILNPRTTTGSSLLHICVNANMFEGDIHRSLQIASEVIHTQRLSSTARSSISDGDRSDMARRGVPQIMPQLPFANNTRNLQQQQLEQQQSQQEQPSCPSVTSLEPATPVVQLIQSLIDAGLEADLIDNSGLSALQVLCLATGIRLADKSRIVELLVRHGAHVDRRALTPEQGGQIRQTLRECGIKPMKFVTLKCLAARRVSESKLSFDRTVLCNRLNESIAIH